MATVTGLTAPQMIEIYENSIVSGEIDIYGDLILITRGGETINAGAIEPDRLLSIQDTASVDLVLTGNGSLATPWLLKANIKEISGESVTSGVIPLDRIPNLTMVGVLEASYIGGPAKVKVGGVLSSTTYGWMSLYKANGPRTVRLMKAGTTWLITGQIDNGGGIIDLVDTAWTTYREYAVSTVYSSLPRAVRLPSGIVVLSGLIDTIAAPTYGDIIGYLPDDCWPDKDVLVPVEMGDTSKSMYIMSTGEIRAGQGYLANQYLTLDGIAYPAAGVATWTDIVTWSSNFGPHWIFDEKYGVPGYWKDPYGTVWLRGLVQAKVATSADNTMMFNLPAGYRSDYYQHIRTTGNDIFAHIGADANGNVDFKLNDPGAVGAWISLGGCTITTPEAKALSPWVVPRALGSSWTIYGSSFSRPMYTRREDGLCMLAGLVNTGSVGSRILALPMEYWPSKGRILIASVSNAARGRIDIGSEMDADINTTGPGAVVMMQGVNQWYSLDNKMWVP